MIGFCIFLLFSFVNSKLGVPPKLLDHYLKNEFTCLNGEKTLPSSAINDEFCDCKDGSDEPGTSACKNGVFYCQNQKFHGSIIPSSHVGDLICDCCDGSDEAVGHCSDRCGAMVAEFNNQIIQEISEHEAGLEFSKAAAILHHQKVIENKIEKEILDKEKSNLDNIISKLEEQKSVIEENIKRVKEDLEDSLKDIVGSEIEFWVEQRKVEIKQEAELKEAERQAAGTPENSETPDLPVEPEKPVESEISEQSIKNKFDEIMNQKIDLNADLTLIKQGLGVVEEPLKAEKEKRDTVVSKLDAINKFLSSDAGPDARFSYAINNKFTVHSQYNYEVEPFKEAKQDYTNIGSWVGWGENYSTMIFDKGTRCWGGPDRSLLVHLSCGATTEILDVREQTKCEYVMKMKTPGACSPQKLEELRRKLIKV